MKKQRCVNILLVINFACSTISCSHYPILNKKNSWDKMRNNGNVTLYLKSKQVWFGRIATVSDQKIILSTLDFQKSKKNNAKVKISKRDGNIIKGSIFRVEEAALMVECADEEMEEVLFQDIIQVVFHEGNSYYTKKTMSKSNVESIVFNSRSIASHIIPQLFKTNDVLIIYTKNDSIHGRIKDFQQESISLIHNVNLKSIDYNEIEKISIIKYGNPLSLKKVIKILLPFALLIGAIWLCPFRNLYSTRH
ncbi:hypothetical protein KAR48_11820 [bacterium]|nr:hypothetical protein [bacterium]